MDVISGDQCFTTLDQEGYILYYFTATWCGPCQRIWNDFLELSKKYNNILFFKVDISNEDNTEICEKCKVDVERVVGADLKGLEEMLKKY